MDELGGGASGCGCSFPDPAGSGNEGRAGKALLQGGRRAQGEGSQMCGWLLCYPAAAAAASQQPQNPNASADAWIMVSQGQAAGRAGGPWGGPWGRQAGNMRTGRAPPRRSAAVEEAGWLWKPGLPETSADVFKSPLTACCLMPAQVGLSSRALPPLPAGEPFRGS